MLLQFSAENFLSIRDKCVLSLEPSADKEHPENLVESGKNKALNAAVIYGANASGKSNLYKAFTVSLHMIKESNVYQFGVPLPVVPFAFDKACAEKPSSFEYVFVADDGLKYVYGFSATRQRIVEEYLYVYTSAKPSMVFDRTETNNYEFTQLRRKELAPLAARNTENKLFLATASSWNAKSTRPAFEWFITYLGAFSRTEQFAGASMNMYSRDEDGRFVRYAEELLKQADFNIDSIRFETTNTDDTLSSFRADKYRGFVASPTGRYISKVVTKHTVKGDDGPEEYELDMADESDGTQKLFYMAPLLDIMLENGGVLILDEIESSLHPIIVRCLIDMFRDPIFNKKGAQLIATTHNTTLLNLSVFRRDQIYFAEKDSFTGATDLYSLGDFSPRKNENIEKGYLLGRYGAIPYPSTGEIV